MTRPSARPASRPPTLDTTLDPTLDPTLGSTLFLPYLSPCPVERLDVVGVLHSVHLRHVLFLDCQPRLPRTPSGPFEHDLLELPQLRRPQPPAHRAHQLRQRRGRRILQPRQQRRRVVVPRILPPDPVRVKQHIAVAREPRVGPPRRAPLLAVSACAACGVTKSMTRAAAVQRTDQRMHAVPVGDEPAHQFLDHEGEGQDALVGGVGVHALDATRGRGGGQWTLGTPDVGTGADLRDSSGTGGDGLIGGDADALCGGSELRAAIVAVVADPRSGLPPTLGPEADTRTGLRPIPAACSEGLYWNRGRGVPHPSRRR